MFNKEDSKENTKGLFLWGMLSETDVFDSNMKFSDELTYEKNQRARL